jgi:methyl-accepting chemotaxis protein
VTEAMVGTAASSRKVAEIIRIIKDTAFQANILALNAVVRNFELTYC